MTRRAPLAAAESERTLSALLEALRGVLCRVAEPIVVLRTVLEQVVAQTGAQRGVFVEVSGDGELRCEVLHHVSPASLEGQAGRFSRGLFEEVLRTRREIRLRDALEHPQFRELESVTQLRMASVLCAPLVIGGRVAAILHLEHDSRGYFQDQHAAAVRALLSTAAPVLEALQATRSVMADRDRLEASESRYRDEAEASRQEMAREWSFRRFVGRSDLVRGLETAVERAARLDFPVLIQGESGTGKGLIARILHHSGPRAAQPFVTVFCPSLEKGMVEAELFGHRKGAFTGAAEDRPGKVAAAEGGTLFLDEIADLAPDIQSKLLRLLQEKTYERLGDAREQHADVRLLAATNRDLELEVSQGRFRRDLFERLNFIPIRVPPLRERPEDIPALLRHCLDQHPTGRWIEFEPEAPGVLAQLEYTWPGNVRNLEQLAARLMLGDVARRVSRDDLVRLLGARDGGGPPGAGAEGDDLAGALARAERSWLETACRKYPDLKRAELAARLRISESALYKKLREYGID